MKEVAPLAPSDLGSVALGERCRVSGRIASREDASTLILADAKARVRVALAAPSEIARGDLAIVAGVVGPRGLLDARIAERIEPMRAIRREISDEPKGEFDRLTHGIGEALWSRSKAIRAVRSLFDEERFLEVDTPAIVPSPGLDVHLDAFEVKGARAPAYLITSPEYQMKRLLVGGVPRCFQIARCFRRGELGDRHNPEFVMLEWYRAFADVEAVMLDTERVVRRVATELRDEEAIEIGGVKIDLGKPFERLSVGEAFSRYAGVTPDETIALASSDEERFFRLLVDAVEPALARSTAPIFLVDFPAPFASLARRKTLGSSSLRALRALRRRRRAVQRLRGAHRSGRTAISARARSRRATHARPPGLPDRRALPRGARGRNAAICGECARPRSPHRALVGRERIADVMPFPASWL